CTPVRAWRHKPTPCCSRPEPPRHCSRWLPMPTPLLPLRTRTIPPFQTSLRRRPAPSTVVVCSAGGLPTAFRNPIGASSICGSPATCCRRERRRPGSRPFSGSPARIFPAATITRTTTCAVPLRVLLFPPQGAPCVSTRVPGLSANAVRRLARILNIGTDLLVSEKIQRRRAPFLRGFLGLLELIRRTVA